MHRCILLLLRERYRRCKKFILKKPLLAIGLLSSIVYLLAAALVNPFSIENLFEQSIIVFAVMAYLIAKIINPTQGMTLDYQLLELKLLSLNEYKFLLGIKLFGGSIILSLLCLTSYTLKYFSAESCHIGMPGGYTKIAVTISALNAMVNVWIFLRNRLDNRIYDLFIAVVVIFSIKYQALYLSILSMTVIVGIYIAIKRVNYDSILSLYKMIYKIGQQKYHGVVYSEKENREIQTNAENLIGKAKEKNADWCERFFDKDSQFMMHKEVARITAHLDKIITYFMICIVISMSGFYIPREYKSIVFLLLAVIAMSFDLEMNQSESTLLLRGFIRRYVVSNIIKNKLLVYTVVNFILMFPSVMLGWKWLIFAFGCSFFIALITLYKCFKKAG